MVVFLCKDETTCLAEHHEKTSFGSGAKAESNYVIIVEDSNVVDVVTAVAGVYDAATFALGVDLEKAALSRDASVGKAESSGCAVATGGGSAGIEIVEHSS